MSTTHFVEWTVGPDETDVIIEFKCTYEGCRHGYFDPVSGAAEPPSGPELEWLSAWVNKTEEKIGPDHPLYKAIDDAWSDCHNDKLYQKAVDVYDNYLHDEDF